MASVMALNEGWTDADGKVATIDFEVLDTFKALRDGVNSGKAAAFMWEKFTTRVRLLQPLVSARPGVVTDLRRSSSPTWTK